MKLQAASGLHSIQIVQRLAGIQRQPPLPTLTLSHGITRHVWAPDSWTYLRESRGLQLASRSWLGLHPQLQVLLLRMVFTFVRRTQRRALGVREQIGQVQIDVLHILQQGESIVETT